MQLLGKPHRTTLFTGSMTSETNDVIDASSILPMLRQSLGLAIESVSVITTGARRRSTGDYPRVYDTLLGSAPYAGRRETWLVVRIQSLGNGDAPCRPSVGTAALRRHSAWRRQCAAKGSGRGWRPQRTSLSLTDDWARQRWGGTVGAGIPSAVMPAG